MKLRILPPSGVPIRVFDLLAGVRDMVTGADTVSAFQQEVCRRFGVRHAVTVSSGRAGLSLLFRALRKMHPGRGEVLIPAFTSFSVPSAVVNAGLKVALYDIDPATLSPVCASLKQAITDQTLCIVVCHLFGFPADLDQVLAEAKKKGIPVIDDAAQAMGARYRGRLVGTFGSAGLFSLSRGKNITAVDGGVIVTDNDALAEAITAEAVDPVGGGEVAALVIKAFMLTFLLHPRCYWLPRSLPFLNLGASLFEPNFALKRFTTFQAAIAKRMLARLDRINNGRSAVAKRYQAFFAGSRKGMTPQVVPEAEPVYLRFPILVEAVEENVLFGAVRSYPAPIDKIRELEPYLATTLSFPGAGFLAQRILTLPTHCYVEEADCDQAAQRFQEAT